MEKRQIPFSPPDIGEEEIAAVADAMRSGWITTGPRTKELEKRLAMFVGNPKVVCLASCTAAEELNLRVLGVGEGDEVIVPAYTYSATASAAIHVGATIKMIDCAKDTFEMDYAKVADAITEKTKAIVPVDLGGIMVDYDTLHEIVHDKRDLFRPNGKIQEAIGRVAIVADCAHSLGAVRKGKNAGNGAVCDFASYSFHAVKNITTAEGGASTWRTFRGIDDEELYHLYQLYSLHGQSKDALNKDKAGSWEYDIVAPWYKCNMTDIMAAIGLVQLQRYPELLARRQAMILRYDKMADQMKIQHLSHTSPIHTSSGHLYLTRIPGITVDERNEIIVKMAERGVACNVHYKPLPMMTGYKNMGFRIEDYPNAYAYYSNLITLPLNTRMSDEDQDYVIQNYMDVLSSYLK